MKLTKNMRLNYTRHDESEKQRVAEFVEWSLMDKNTSLEGDELIKIPSDILLKKGNDSKNCGKHIYQFAGEVSTAGILRREREQYIPFTR